jgi:hypothetical protein
MTWKMSHWKPQSDSLGRRPQDGEGQIASPLILHLHMKILARPRLRVALLEREVDAACILQA